jgi:predicted GTPase
MEPVGFSVGAVGVATSSVDTLSRELQKHGEKRSDKDDIIIALMGETGSGKSSFIKRITGSDTVKIGHGLNSGPLVLSERRNVTDTEQKLRTWKPTLYRKTNV